MSRPGHRHKGGNYQFKKKNYREKDHQVSTGMKIELVQRHLWGHKLGNRGKKKTKKGAPAHRLCDAVEKNGGSEERDPAIGRSLRSRSRSCGGHPRPPPGRSAAPVTSPPVGLSRRAFPEFQNRDGERPRTQARLPKKKKTPLLT